MKKNPIQLKEELVGIIKCNNPKCISNQTTEPITSKFIVINDKTPVEFRCNYCDRIIKSDEIEAQFE